MTVFPIDIASDLLLVSVHYNAHGLRYAGNRCGAGRLFFVVLTTPLLHEDSRKIHIKARKTGKAAH